VKKKTTTNDDDDDEEEEEEEEEKEEEEEVDVRGEKNSMIFALRNAFDPLELVPHY